MSYKIIYMATHPAFTHTIITKANVIDFRDKYGRLPGTNDFKSIPGFPNPRTIQRRGGIEKFYENLGIEYEKRTKGPARAAAALRANQNSFHSENDFYKYLVKLFGELSVHRQSPYSTLKNSVCRSDFKVYTKTKPFFVDVFSASDMHNFAGCVNIKLKKLIAIDADPAFDIYLVSLNEEFVTSDSIKYFLEHRKNPIPANIKICTRADAMKKIAIIST